ncbi:hypothetical protein Q31a_14350 [Aureliella helgolandensis]|uniref:Uncharacterized protein n=1 Tax=Aureliella helgolandensis TaxID=2527968 RepID=A0A518G3L9_9BACT|nr:hypothetical protein Q31a_14350 [Aureliella helgolandensis]
MWGGGAWSACALMPRHEKTQTIAGLGLIGIGKWGVINPRLSHFGALGATVQTRAADGRGVLMLNHIQPLTGLRRPLKQPLALAFFLANLGTALADLEARIAFANYVDTTTTPHNLAIRVTKFKSADRGNNFHGLKPYLPVQIETALRPKIGHPSGNQHLTQSV